jgi:type 1 glutamine amidotransferase
MSDTLDAFKDADKLLGLDLIVPVWTMGTITREQREPVEKAVISGVGLAGCHGGMCDAFRNDCNWQFMTGGQFVGHPGNDGTKYTVKPTTVKSSITEGIGEFPVNSEQYYMHVAPDNRVLMTTPMPTADGPHVPNGKFEQPVVWTRLHDKGRVFYNALGHQANILEAEPCLTLMRRGFKWATKGSTLT